MNFYGIGLFLILLFIPLKGICGDLEVQITGLTNTKGQILVGVYNKESNFPEKGFELKGIIINPIKKKSIAIFKDLPEGIYAVGVIHDENKDGRLDKNFFGIPKEGYGSSNNAEATFGSPSFKDASFFLKTTEKKISIAMKY